MFEMVCVQMDRSELISPKCYVTTHARSFIGLQFVIFRIWLKNHSSMTQFWTHKARGAHVEETQTAYCRKGVDE